MKKPVIVYSNGAQTTVKNLGWLLRNWQSVKELGFTYSGNGMNDGDLWAKGFINGVAFTYLTDFADLTVCWQWVNRSVFKTLPFLLSRIDKPEGMQKKFIIGNEEWVNIQKLEYAEQVKAILN